MTNQTLPFHADDARRLTREALHSRTPAVYLHVLGYAEDAAERGDCSVDVCPEGPYDPQELTPLLIASGFQVSKGDCSCRYGSILLAWPEPRPTPTFPSPIPPAPLRFWQTERATRLAIWMTIIGLIGFCCAVVHFRHALQTLS